MFSTSDTIVAIATPQGRGGLGVVRISGPAALRVGLALSATTHLEPRHATLARVGGGAVHDQAIVTYFPNPASYTGEDVVEISAHGSPVVLRAIVEGAIEAGARLAEPGEFTLRAYLHGRIDLVQAEAVADLIEAVTPLQVRAAFDQLDGTLTKQVAAIDEALFDISTRLEASLDFPEEGYHFVDPGTLAGEIAGVSSRIERLLDDGKRGRLVREGARVAILGRPNVGKSTLFNALAGADRAIVTAIPGTTRDLVTEVVDVEGMPITLVDTAGMRVAAADDVEAEGILRARAVAASADLLLVVVDGSQPLHEEDRAVLNDTRSRPRVIVVSKADLPAMWDTGELEVQAVAVAPPHGTGLQTLRQMVVEALSSERPAADTPAVTNLRHVTLLAEARDALRRAEESARATAPEEFVAADVTQARGYLEEITGRRTADDTLNAIFSRFCIGK
ncbi:MAG: tRNA uridine-5-carboxymethylaminomethyl(34) synthesis GTPase MnmE [Vicinamibacterales bacterium]